jgi:hypothetical protein
MHRANPSQAANQHLVASIDKLANPKVFRPAYVAQILSEFVERRAQDRKIAREGVICAPVFTNWHGLRSSIEVGIQ